MLDLFKFFGKGEGSSKDVAKERLKLVLIHDRTSCSEKFLEMVKGDLLNVISDYMEIDESGLDIKITRTESDEKVMPALVANIPIKKMKNR
ncbi:cell division topological specificity factor MinE [Caminicella sporogenes DSM 14501]|uniref:Cell division topological specificity factor n=1 Tax=Caminicella sporogenes DSM 14501 TaxID=1121266 RepID=A0A1M6LW34_9FIRM|nr:cell division topological specificity factor MinE [Caminicella sporogenes]RKD27972.1 cell division topological specificity factor MinE [Caminicella sporogenes]WIF94425.1 cell division topological specificity factor MinE [Caminicella sporogenes]SHJ75414.1 cell division topological specificity factor MinE [Caminicella sporogenes DSM 14501]